MKSIRTLMITLISCLSLAATAYAGDMRGPGDGTGPERTGGGPGFYGCPMMGGPGGACGISLKQIMRLDLTDAQRTEVTAVMDKYRDTQKSLMDQMAAARQACAENRRADAVFDEVAIRQNHQNISAVKEEMAVLRGRIVAELKPILTETQMEKLAGGPLGRRGNPEALKGRMRPDCPMMDALQDTQHADTD